VCCLRSAVMMTVVLAALGTPADADQAAWLHNDWAARRVVEARVSDAGQAGGEVAVADFHTGGMARPDGADVRVAVQGRRLVKHRVLQVGPGDFVRVAFEAMPKVSTYYIYFGNPKAEKTDKAEALQIQRGVLLEVRGWKGGQQPGKIGQVRELWSKAPPVASAFVPKIAFGHNPLIDTRRPALLHATGWFVAPRPGTYQIATSSEGGSWIEIDGRPVVAWPGGHGPIGRAKFTKDIVLTQSLHRIDYWNVAGGGRTVAVAAARMPEQKGPRFDAIPASVFLPVTQAKLVEMDLRGEKLVADFFPEHAGEAWWPDNYAVRIQFRNLTKDRNLSRTGTFLWNFGDGQTSTEPEPAHVYLLQGEYEVTLLAKRGTLSNTFRSTIGVERDWRNQATRTFEPAKPYAEAVATYDLSKLDARSLPLAVSLFEHEKLLKPLTAAATQLVFHGQAVPEKQMIEVTLLLGKTLRAGGKPQEAIRAYQQLEKHLKRTDRKATAAVQVAETLLKDLRQYDAAEKEYRRVLKTYAAGGAAWELRRAHMGLGDIWRQRGDGDKARQAYTDADKITVAPRAPNMEAVRVGTLARYVEEYTREKDWEFAFKFLDDWAWEFPLAKLEGHWSLLRAQALVAKGDVPAALREALALTAANPYSPYAVRLLMLAAQCHVDQGDRTKARLLLQTAVEDYPEDARCDEARQRLQGLGGPVNTDAKG